MTILQAIILGAIQGITEFIPVSSSGHLVLGQQFLGLPHNFTFDVLLNFGTLLALVIFFRKKLYALVHDALTKKRFGYIAMLALATIPAVVIGYTFGDIIDGFGESTWIVVAALLIVGILMIVVGKEKAHVRVEKDKQVTGKDALFVGAAQAIALIPGTSRSGITILAGLSRGFSSHMATDFSFLLALPVIFGASMKVLLSSEGREFISQNLSLFIAGNLASFIFGALAIATLVAFLRHHSLAIFGWYRIALAGILIVLLLTHTI